MNFRNTCRFVVTSLALACVGCQTSEPIRTASEVDSSAAVIRYDTIHHPVIGRSGMVVTQNQIATQVGHKILEQGGNAVDASVAVGFALAVTLPRAGNLGGSGFMLIHRAETGNTVAIDYRSVAPIAANPGRYKGKTGEIDWQKMTFGPMAPGVPGTVAGLHAAWRQFGSMSWSDLLQPAYDLAHDGITVTSDLAFAFREAQSALKQYPGSASTYLKPDGSTYTSGERFLQPDLAWSIQQLREGEAQAFYNGPIAKKITQHMAQVGGLITMADLAAYQAKIRKPIAGSYRGHQVLTAPPVSSGGVTLIQMLNVLQNFPLGEMGVGSAQSYHLIAETMKRAAANRRQSIGDPDFVSVPVRGFTSKELAASIAKSIDGNKATPVATIQAANVQRYESSDTTHYSIMDRHGNAVSNTYTLGYSFGSGFVVPGTGILLDNQVRNFSYNQAGHANAIAPGKRMVSTMTPTIILDPDGEVLLVTGTPGGGRIINIILQVIINVIDHGMNIAQATHAPRINQQWRSPELGAESGFGIDTISLLEALGHDVQQQQTMGSTQSILYSEGVYYGAADPRRPGALALGLN